MVKRNDRWSALSMLERADLIKLYVNNGITSLDDIKKDYNSFSDGGDTNNPTTTIQPLSYTDRMLKTAQHGASLKTSNTDVQESNVEHQDPDLSFLYTSADEIPLFKDYYEEDTKIPYSTEQQTDSEQEYTNVLQPLIYKVKSGDSLSKIAKSQNVSMDRLIELNPQLLERKGGINSIFIGEDIQIGQQQPEDFKFMPVEEKQLHIKDYKDTPVSLLYKEVTGQNWPPKGDIYADMYDGTKDTNLEIKQMLVDEANRKNTFKISYEGKIKDLNSQQHVGILKTENIENPSGIDYSSPNSVPVYQKKGANTTALNKAFTFDSMQSFDDGFVCDEQCATTLTNHLMRTKNYNLIDLYNFRGSAWTILQNAEKQGVPIVNIYDDLQDKNLTKQEVINFAHKKAQDENFKKEIQNSLSAGNVVTLMNPDSSMFKVAKEESKGRVLSTHAGVIVDVGGKMYVAHSMGGSRKLTPVDSLLDGKGMVITGIAKYNELDTGEKDNYQTADLSAYGFNLQEDQLTRTDRISSVSAYRAERSLHNNAEALKKNLYVSDEALQFASEILPALMYRETASGYLSSDSYRESSAQSTFVHDTVRNVREAITGVSESIGLTNVKLKDENQFFSPRDLYKLGLKEELTREQKESPELTGVLTAVSIDRRMKHLDRILGEHKKEVPPDIYNALVIMSWSQGFKNIDINVKNFIKTGDLNELSQYKTFNDYTSIEQYMKYLGK